MFNKAKSLIKVDMCMTFYDDTKPLCLETDASGVCLGVALLQLCEGTACQKDIVPDNTTLCPIVFASKSLTGAECWYHNIEREALDILHGLEKFHQYCLAREVLIITNHKLLVATFKRCGNVSAVHTMHSFKNSSVQGPDYIQTWAWDFHCRLAVPTQPQGGKDKPIKIMDIRIDAIQSVTDIPECILISQIQQASVQDEHPQHL